MLSVGTDVYTSFDARMLLSFWNTLTQKPVPQTTRWLSFKGLPVSRERDLLSNISAWPKDAIRLLTMALVWAEAKKLNLFVPTEKELATAIAKVRQDLSVATMSENEKRYFSAMPEARMKEIVGIVLRAQNYERVRGGIERNISLTNTSWSWHFSEPPPPPRSGGNAIPSDAGEGAVARGRVP